MSEHVDIEQKPLTLDEEIENLSHEDLLEISQSSLRRLIAADPLLCDLPVDVTTEEVLAQIAVAQGQSITVTVTRYSESPLNVVIPQRGTTVLDLKKAIKRTFTLKQQRQRSKTKISWRYVWRTYNLQNVETGRVMKDNTKEVSEYGIVNKSELRFVKKLRKDRPETC
ncbi:U11/U12 small nuclear ribonucleoprotein 25 kDa protein [Anoplophora glabripennis]|uniref:U11/U12 small nuclear ribonucleoprotein 25 kDa protein n=1 Tax=Anoplophora glabripennis TaxID=217634 RepID=UPI00087552A3|nr:U11/U12 small nuclear ribonucleoprotein 25 kDa protein [Anoplophora glabripennis]